MMDFLLWCLTLAIAGFTALSLSTSTRWWIRMWDFPRLHIFVLASLLVIAAAALGASTAMILILAACALYQGVKIYPFTRLARPEIAFREPDPGQGAVTLLASNVEMENTAHNEVADLIARTDPDVILLMETDETWALALQGVLQPYSTVVSHTLSNHYGMIFATRLAAHSAKTVFLTDDQTPVLLADLKAPDGRPFHFIGLHPRPPVPGEDTDERDAQIRTAATLTRHSDHPVVVMGDFNDVAWSWSTTRFKHHGRFLDPRIGRGLMSSFDARHPILRFPIDQMYVTRGIRIASYDLCNGIGSDHFPLKARISIDGPRRG